MTSQAAAMARTMQPSVVALEDCDFVAEDRSFDGSTGVLFEVLDAVDGIDGDVDVTSRRPPTGSTCWRRRWSSVPGAWTSPSRPPARRGRPTLPAGVAKAAASASDEALSGGGRPVRGDDWVARRRTSPAGPCCGRSPRTASLPMTTFCPP